MKLKAHTLEWSGTHYEIGQKIGERTASMPFLRKQFTNGMQGFGESEVKKAKALFDQYCPGLNEELQGFADTLEVSLHRVFFYGMTYLRPQPRCSQIALQPSMTESDHPLLARNYEFNHRAEDFCLVKTSAEGKYTHLGTSVLNFGRDDGFNEHGLAVTMSSCGMPVGALPMMRKPKHSGLQFWAVIRALLENCKDVEDALYFMKDSPIAYNINLMLIDQTGNVALAETLDGKFAVKRLEPGMTEHYLHVTNHAVLPELVSLEPKAMKHSLIRYDWIKNKLDNAKRVTVSDLKALLLSKFPDGLTCHYYKEFFGTTKSMIIDPKSGTIDLCWGGKSENGWNQYQLSEPVANTTTDIKIDIKKFDKIMMKLLPIKI